MKTTWYETKMTANNAPHLLQVQVVNGHKVTTLLGEHLTETKQI
ncbi:hypothetical protein [Lysinibacillus sp. Ag94]|nr:hypothetical protein [Lysinibacillus sp. Ag94]